MKNRVVVGTVLTALLGGGASLGVREVRAQTPQTVDQKVIEVLRRDGKLTDEEYERLRLAAMADAEQREALAKLEPLPDWLDRVSLFGDVRLRGEGFFQEDTEDRLRARIRARLGVKVVATDDLEAGIGLATGDPGDPISENQTLGDVFSKKPISLDQAYLAWKASRTFRLGMPGISVVGGKFPNPVFRPKAVMTSELIWDGDVYPEGFAQTVTLVDDKEAWLKAVKVHALEWVTKEVSDSGDAWIFGAQAQADVALSSKLSATIAVADYYFSVADRIAQEANRNSALALTNAVVLADGTVVDDGVPYRADSDNRITGFTGGFNLVSPTVQLTWKDAGMPAWPISAYVEYVVNTEAEGGEDTALGIGAGIGQTKERGDWAFSAGWQRIERDAVVSVLTGSDFGRGGTNGVGPFVRVDWMPIERLVLSGKSYFVDLVEPPPGEPNPTLTRLQLDAVLTF